MVKPGDNPAAVQNGLTFPVEGLAGLRADCLAAVDAILEAEHCARGGMLYGRLDGGARRDHGRASGAGHVRNARTHSIAKRRRKKRGVRQQRPEWAMRFGAQSSNTQARECSSLATHRQCIPVEYNVRAPIAYAVRAHADAQPAPSFRGGPFVPRHRPEKRLGRPDAGHRPDCVHPARGKTSAGTLVGL